MRQSARRRKFNLAAKDKIKQSVKEVRRFIKSSDKSAAAEAMKKAMAALDKAAKKGIIHKNHASRKKSRLSKAIGK